MRFIANSVLNVQGFTSEAKDVFFSLYKGILPVYMGIFMLDVKYEQDVPLVTPEEM